MATTERELLNRGTRVVHRGIISGIFCAVMTIPGFILYRNGLAWKMEPLLIYGPLVCAGLMALCSVSGFFVAYKVRRSIKNYLAATGKAG